MRGPCLKPFNLFSHSPFFSANEPYWQSNRSCHPPGCNTPSPCVFVIVSWQSELPARPGWQLVVLTAALPENGTLPVELQLPPLLLPLLSIACRCCINIPCQGDCNNCEIHAMFQRHVNFSSGTIKEGNTVPGFSQALKSEKGFFHFFSKGGLFHKGSEIHPIFTALFLSWAALWAFVRQTCRDPQRIWKWG